MIRFGVHILAFMATSVLSMVSAFLAFGMAYRIGSNIMINGSWPFWRIYSVFGCNFAGSLMCIIAVVSIIQVFRPFFQDLDDLSREPLFLEFQYAGMALISPYPLRMLIGFFFSLIKLSLE